MATAIRIVMTAPIISIPKNFHMNLIQFDHSIFAIAREPIRQPEVGTIRFVKASPSWNARTDVWRDTPRRSASGAMIGMVIAAWPEPDTTKKLKTDWNTYISTAAAAPERPARACEMPYIMVLITVGVVGSEPPKHLHDALCHRYNECRTDQVLCTVLEGNGNIIYFHVIQMENDTDHTCHNSMMKNWVAISAI